MAALFISFCQDIIFSLISFRVWSAFFAWSDANLQNTKARIRLMIDASVPMVFKSIVMVVNSSNARVQARRRVSADVAWNLLLGVTKLAPILLSGQAARKGCCDLD